MFNIKNLLVIENNVLFCQPHKKEPKKVTATDKFVKIIVKHVFHRNTSRLDVIFGILINIMYFETECCLPVQPTHVLFDF